MLHVPARLRRPLLSVFPLVLLITLITVGFLAAPSWARQKEEATWPQEFKKDGAKLVFYQPQWDALEKDVLTGRSALSVTAPGSSTPVFGAAWLEADVIIDREAGRVLATTVRVKRVHLPDSTPAEVDRLFATARKVAKDIDVTIGLDTLGRSLEATRHEREQAAQLRMTAPRILFESSPAFLVVLDGEPKSVKVKGTDLERIVNTPSFLVRDTDRKRLYLQGAGRWYEAKGVKGPWKVIDEPPDEVAALYKSGTDSARAAADPDGEEKVEEQPPKGPAPAVIVATEPTELIVTDGAPKFNPIAGGDLLFLSNTASDVLMEVESQKYYVLLSGRWYRAATLSGPWEYIRADNLPDSFASIPSGSAKGDVLASVAGTPEAEEAVLDAEVPQTAAVKRSEAHLAVEYDGEPQFRRISGTDVEYAINTPTQVLRINGRYYAVDQGVWFVSDSPDGPWELADEVPADIQEIPPDSPAYNTKYVYVYDSNPEVVTYGYLPGYLGAYPYYGSVVWGTGWYYPGWWGAAYYPYPWTWGFGAHYSSGWGWSFGFGWGYPYYAHHSYYGYSWYGYPAYAHYPYYPYWGYPSYAWGYPGWWGPYGHCHSPYYPGGHPYNGRYVRAATATAAGAPVGRVAAVAAAPATRLPAGTNVNLYREPRNAGRVAETRDKFARVSPRRGVTTGPAQASVRPGNPGRPTETPSAGAARVPSNRGVAARPATPGRPTSGATQPGVQGQNPRATRPGQAARPAPSTPPTGATAQGQTRPRQAARSPQAGRPATPGTAPSQHQMRPANPSRPSQPGRPSARPSQPGASQPQARPANPSRPSQPGRTSTRPSQPGASQQQARPASPQTRPSSPQASRPSSSQQVRPGSQGRVYSRPSQPARPSASMRGPSTGWGGGSRTYSRPSVSSMGGGRSMSSAPRSGGYAGGRGGGGGGARMGGGGPRGGGGARR